MELELFGKVAVITGGGTGVGRATALFLARKGCSLALLGRRLDKLQETSGEVKALGIEDVRVEVYQCDITKDVEVKAVFAKIGADFGQIDFLVNNAGINTQKKFDVISREEAESELHVKFFGILYCALEAEKIFKSGGAVVNITSVTAYTGGSSSPAYYCGNAIANNLTKSLAQQLVSKSIRVNAVAPGFIYPTGFTENYDPEKLKKVAKSNPMKRLCSPEDVAKAIYFLLSDLSSYVNGHTLHVNGGYYMN